MNQSILSLAAILFASIALPTCIADAPDMDDPEAALADEATDEAEDALLDCVTPRTQETLAFTYISGSISVISPEPSSSIYYPDDFIIEFDAPPPGNPVFTYGGLLRTAYMPTLGARPLNGTECPHATVKMSVYAFLPSTSHPSGCWVVASAPMTATGVWHPVTPGDLTQGTCQLPVRSTR